MTYKEIIKEYKRLQKDLEKIIKRLDKIEMTLALENWRRSHKGIEKKETGHAQEVPLEITTPTGYTGETPVLEAKVEGN